MHLSTLSIADVRQLCGMPFSHQIIAPVFQSYILLPFHSVCALIFHQVVFSSLALIYLATIVFLVLSFPFQ
jgi:hypothetical protein